MRDPHVRFCERHGGVISRAYSTLRAAGVDALTPPSTGRRWERELGRPAQSAAVSAFGSSRSMSFW